MIYLVEDKPAKISIGLLDRAVLFAFEYLKLPEDLIIEIVFEDDPHDPYYCGSSDMEEGVGQIWINPKLKKKDIIATLFHEMVHVRQISEGSLEIGEWPVPSKWKGEFVVATYKDLPWEKEAYFLEEQLVTLFGEMK